MERSPARALARAAPLTLVFIEVLPRDLWALEPKNIQAAEAEYFWEAPE